MNLIDKRPTYLVWIAFFVAAFGSASINAQDTGSASSDVVRAIKKYVTKEKQARSALLRIIEKGDKSGPREWDTTCMQVKQVLNSIDIPANDASNGRWLKEEKDNWDRIANVGGKIAHSNSFLQTELSELKKDYLQSQRDSKEVPKTVSSMYQRLSGKFGQHMSKANELEEKAQKFGKLIGAKEADIDIPSQLDDLVGEFDEWVETLDEYQARYRAIQKFSDGLYRYFYENKTELRDECVRQMSELRRNVKRLVSKKLTSDPASEYKKFEKDVEKIVLDRLDSYGDLFEDWDDVNKPLMRTLSEFNEDYIAPHAADVLKGLPTAFLGVKVPKFAYDPDGSMDAVLNRAGTSYNMALKVWQNKQYELLEIKLVDLNDQMETLASEFDKADERLQMRYESLMGAARSESEKFIKNTKAKQAEMQKRLDNMSAEDVRRDDLEEDIVVMSERMEAEEKALKTRLQRYQKDWDEQKRVMLDNYRDQQRWFKEQLDKVGK